MICTMIVITFTWIFHVIFLWNPRMSMVPFQLHLSACSQVSFEQPVQPHLPLLSWTTDEFLFHTGNSCYWSPCLWLYFALSTAKYHFMSITPNQQSHLNAFHVIIGSSSVLTIPSKILSSHTAAGHTPTLCTQVRMDPFNRPKTRPKGAAPPTSLHPDDFLWIPLSIQRTLFACNGCIFSPGSFLPFNSCLEPPSSFQAITSRGAWYHIPGFR